MQRRDFLAAGALATGGVGAAAAEAQAAAEPTKASLLKPGATVLFQGDSITDVGRDRSVNEPNHPGAMGDGYPFLATAETLISRPDDKLNFYNRGISGNKVFQLAERWDRDCLDLKPDVLSVLIGVNDIWHRLNGDYDGTVETYRDDYRALLERTKEKLPDVKLVICEPFALKTGAVTDAWFPDFDAFRAAAKAIADEFADAWVPFHTVLTAAEQFAPSPTWAHDGVHPSPKGAALMASAWLRAVGEPA